MTAEHHDSKPIIPGNFASLSLTMWPAFTVVTPMSAEATSPANPRQTAH